MATSNNGNFPNQYLPQHSMNQQQNMNQQMNPAMGQTMNQMMGQPMASSNNQQTTAQYMHSQQGGVPMNYNPGAPQQAMPQYMTQQPMQQQPMQQQAMQQYPSNYPAATVYPTGSSTTGSASQSSSSSSGLSKSMQLWLYIVKSAVKRNEMSNKEGEYILRIWKQAERAGDMNQVLQTFQNGVLESFPTAGASGGTRGQELLTILKKYKKAVSMKQAALQQQRQQQHQQQQMGGSQRQDQQMYQNPQYNYSAPQQQQQQYAQGYDQQQLQQSNQYIQDMSMYQGNSFNSSHQQQQQQGNGYYMNTNSNGIPMSVPGQQMQYQMNLGSSPVDDSSAAKGKGKAGAPGSGSKGKGSKDGSASNAGMKRSDSAVMSVKSMTAEEKKAEKEREKKQKEMEKKQRDAERKAQQQEEKNRKMAERMKASEDKKVAKTAEEKKKAQQKATAARMEQKQRERAEKKAAASTAAASAAAAAADKKNLNLSLSSNLNAIDSSVVIDPNTLSQDEISAHYYQEMTTKPDLNEVGLSIEAIGNNTKISQSIVDDNAIEQEDLWSHLALSENLQSKHNISMSAATATATATTTTGSIAVHDEGHPWQYYNILDKTIMEIIVITIAESYQMKLSMNTLKIISNGLQLHLKNILSVALKCAYESTGAISYASYNALANMIINHGKGQAIIENHRNVGMCWGPNVHSLLLEEERLARIAITKYNIEVENFLKLQIIQSEESRSIVGNKRKVGGMSESQQQWWIKDEIAEKMGNLSWEELAHAQFKLKVAKKYDLCGFGIKSKSKKKNDFISELPEINLQLLEEEAAAAAATAATAMSFNKNTSSSSITNMNENNFILQQQCPLISFHEIQEITANDLAYALSRTVFSQTNHGNMKRARLSNGKSLRAWILGVDYPKTL